MKMDKTFQTKIWSSFFLDFNFFFTYLPLIKVIFLSMGIFSAKMNAIFEFYDKFCTRNMYYEIEM